MSDRADPEAALAADPATALRRDAPVPAAVGPASAVQTALAALSGGATVGGS